MEIHHEQEEFPQSKRDIAIYPGRVALLMLWMGFLLFIFCGGLVLFWFMLSWSVFFGPFQQMSEELIVLNASAFLCAVLLLLWQFWRLRRNLAAHSPVLMFSDTGIQMRAAPGSGNFFISWPEIGAITVYSYLGNRYLCIVPKYPTRYQSRFHALKRWSMLLTKPSPINVSLMYLDRPVHEIFQQIYHYYSDELSMFRIVLQP